MTPKRKEQLRQKLQASRNRLRERLPRFAEPLVSMRFLAYKPLHHMSTNGESIFFDPDWLWKLPSEGLDFMLAHQLMHIYLDHIHRSAFYKGDRFHLACDVIANSYLRRLGWTAEKLTGVGTVFHETFYPVTEGWTLTPQEAFSRIPMDPAALAPAARRRYMVDDEACWDAEGDAGGELILSPEDPEEGTTAAIRRSGQEPAVSITGWALTAAEPAEPDIDPDEPDAALIEVIEAIIRARETQQKKNVERESDRFRPAGTAQNWERSQKNALKSIRTELSRSRQRAQETMADERFWQKVNRTCLDWRQLLDAFLQEEICDYSFLPPDRRLQEGDFFLPDFSDRLVQPMRILFMVDTSGSVSDELLSEVYTEIQSAIEQFDGKLTGLLGFFDLQVYPPLPFGSVEDIRRRRIYGGGGTDFHCVFRDCAPYFGDEHLSSMVILTDGQGEFPAEEESFGIPVLWLLTDQSVLPPWGRCAYLQQE